MGTARVRKCWLIMVSVCRLPWITVHFRREEFESHVHQIVYVSATPGDYEMEQTETVIEQIIRPTGLLDPEVEVRPTMGQMDDLLGEINARVEKGERDLYHHFDQEDGRRLDRLLQGNGCQGQIHALGH